MNVAKWKIIIITAKKLSFNAQHIWRKLKGFNNKRKINVFLCN